LRTTTKKKLPKRGGITNASRTNPSHSTLPGKKKRLQSLSPFFFHTEEKCQSTSLLIPAKAATASKQVGAEICEVKELANAAVGAAATTTTTTLGYGRQNSVGEGGKGNARQTSTGSTHACFRSRKSRDLQIRTDPDQETRHGSTAMKLSRHKCRRERSRDGTAKRAKMRAHTHHNSLVSGLPVLACSLSLSRSRSPHVPTSPRFPVPRSLKVFLFLFFP